MSGSNILSKEGKENRKIAVMAFPGQEAQLNCHWGKYDDNGVRTGRWIAFWSQMPLNFNNGSMRSYAWPHSIVVDNTQSHAESK